MKKYIKPVMEIVETDLENCILNGSGVGVFPEGSNGSTNMGKNSYYYDEEDEEW